MISFAHLIRGTVFINGRCGVLIPSPRVTDSRIHFWLRRSNLSGFPMFFPLKNNIGGDSVFHEQNSFLCAVPPRPRLRQMATLLGTFESQAYLINCAKFIAFLLFVLPHLLLFSSLP